MRSIGCIHGGRWKKFIPASDEHTSDLDSRNTQHITDNRIHIIDAIQDTERGIDINSIDNAIRKDPLCSDMHTFNNDNYSSYAPSTHPEPSGDSVICLWLVFKNSSDGCIKGGVRYIKRKPLLSRDLIGLHIVPILR